VTNELSATVAQLAQTHDGDRTVFSIRVSSIVPLKYWLPPEPGVPVSNEPQRQ